MPPGRYGTRHIDRWSVSVASCEATTFRHRACAHAVSARRTPWSSPLPLCETQHKTQLLASVYRTFYVAIKFSKLAFKRHEKDSLLTSSMLRALFKSRISARKLKTVAMFLATHFGVIIRTKEARKKWPFTKGHIS